MEKNHFLIINDLIYEMYNWNSLEDIKQNFFQRLKIIIPFSYASILLKANDDPDDVTLCNPICYPDYFTEAEQNYISNEPESDYTLWNLYARESKLIRSSAILDDLTLYRTRIDGAFATDDMFYMRALGMHLNAVMHRILTPAPATPVVNQAHLTVLQKKYALTGRETEILSHLYRFESNTEIADALGIRDNTLQKHLQNLFRKLGVASKWEILRL